MLSAIRVKSPFSHSALFGFIGVLNLLAFFCFSLFPLQFILLVSQTRCCLDISLACLGANPHVKRLPTRIVAFSGLPEGSSAKVVFVA
jgi:hypothetical protein